MTSRLLVSVVVPLGDHRGHAVEAIRSWSAEQTFPRDAFEVVVISDGKERGIEAEIAEHLQGQDRCITLSGGSLHECYNAGGHAARGELLLFTEAHVKATPECLSRIVERFDAGDIDMAALASGGINVSRFAAQEQLIYEEALPARIASGWNLFTVRGCAIQREIFLRAGGFLAEYGHFGELILGARLRDLGARMTYAERAKVFHFNEGDVEHFRSELTAYGRDEIRFRAEHPDSPLLEYFGPSPIWERRQQWSRSGAGRKCGEGITGLFSDLVHGKFKAAGRKLEQAVRFLPAAVLGTDWLRLRARLAVAQAMLLLYVLYPTQRGYYRAFCAMWNTLIGLGRVQAVADWLDGEAHRREQPVAGAGMPMAVRRAA